MIKKIVLGLFILTGFLGGFFSVHAWGAIWQDYSKPYYDSPWVSTDPMETDFWAEFTEHAVEEKDSLLKSLFWVFKLDGYIAEWETQPALVYIKMIINWALALVSFVALCLLIYAFYNVVIWDEKKIDTAKTYLKNIAIAIAIMGVSWLLVSFLYWLYESPAKNDVSVSYNTFVVEHPLYFFA